MAGTMGWEAGKVPYPSGGVGTGRNLYGNRVYQELTTGAPIFIYF